MVEAKTSGLEMNNILMMEAGAAIIVAIVMFSGGDVALGFIMLFCAALAFIVGGGL